MPASRSRHRVLLCVVAALITSAVACGRDVTVPEASVAGGSPEFQRQAVMATDVAESRPAPSAQPAPLLPDAQPGQGGSTVTMIIRTGSASIEVDSLETAVAAVQRMATVLGGMVGNTSLSSGEYQVRSATIELRIPSSRFNEALEGLTPIGKVENVQSNAQDVSEEFVDVSARVANAKRLEERLISLLANRTGKLEEVLAVERELARIREEIERYEGRIRFLQTRVATSTLTITVHEKQPLISNSPGQNVIAEAFKSAWRNFVAFVAGFISALGFLIPLAVLFAPMVYAWRRWVRRKARDAAQSVKRPD